MTPLSLVAPPGRAPRLLCLGAHSDDIEIGCGGTVLSLCAAHPDLEVHWVVFSADGAREQEARRGADLFLAGAARSRVEVHAFRDGFLPFQGSEVKECFEALKEVPSPDLVLTHFEHDRHQDHRLLAELSWNTFRDHLILEYEIPKFDGDLRSPNCFVPLDADTRARKLDLLGEVFGTQRSKRWFSRETFDALMRLRGVECASATGYAEGFHARKITFRFR